LAAGSDQLVAELALELGYKLYAPLPLPREKYVADFRDNPEAEARFSTLLGRAEAVFELADDDNRPAAYQAVGRFVIEHSDVLIAIWDGEEAKGPGGTAQIVAEAVSADRLVVVVAPRPEDCRIANAISATNQPLEKQIEGHIRRLLAPWLRTGAPAGDAADLADMSTSRASHLADQLRDYAAFCREKPLHARWLWKLGAARVWSAIWPAFIGLFKARVQLAATTGKPRARLTRPTTCGPTNWQPTMPLCIAAPS
jgi:hypothetical protein